MKRLQTIMLAASALGLAACGADAAGEEDATSAPSVPVAPSQSAHAPVAVATGAAPAPAAIACTDFRGDLEDSDMLRIYYAAAALPPPREKWAERVLQRLDRSLPPEEAWNRATAEAEAQWNAVKDLRCVLLRTNAEIGTYDAARGGLKIGALRPDIHFTFNDYGDRAKLKLRNASAAEIWRMAPERGQALTANNDLWGTTLVARVRIVGARPTQEGGVLEGEVVSYDLIPRENSRAAMETVQVEG